MSTRNCEWCGGSIRWIHQDRQRFCRRECSDAFYMEERRQAVDWFRAMGMTVQREGKQQPQQHEAA
jgi:hypothetical protein